MTLFATILSLLVIPFVAADVSQLRLFHRLHHPTADQAPFSERGHVLIAQNNSVSVHLASSFAQDLSSFAEALNSIQDTDLLLYQVALEREGDATEAQWDISSVKACHLVQSTSESIHLHTVDTHNPKPYGIDYFVSPIPHDGACPRSGSKKSAKYAATPSSFDSFVKVQSIVTLKGSNLPPLPQLATPPPISPEGEQIIPVPEQTFLQKYWMYIVGVLLVTMLAGGGEEERPRK